MKLVLQRVRRASVSVDGDVVGETGEGLCILIGVAPTDTERDVRALAQKAVNLRVFDDADGKMNKSLLEIGGGVLAVSQFTLYADCGKGRRPSYAGAASPEHARSLYELFLNILADMKIKTGSGIFGARMVVEIVNDGPVTIILDSSELSEGRL
ncbi:MAG: D-tyrosyl-tRNA(Tyr) deacylase [Synergistaceae bacterium]|jgi:D-tyrosyl-tRNA(Tyr) deacylase|nr:D-tyrosyl-tRNA(Tyr) deacylase [Synergistaceae bacterium]